MKNLSFLSYSLLLTALYLDRRTSICTRSTCADEEILASPHIPYLVIGVIRTARVDNVSQQEVLSFILLTYVHIYMCILRLSFSLKEREAQLLGEGIDSNLSSSSVFFHLCPALPSFSSVSAYIPLHIYVSLDVCLWLARRCLRRLTIECNNALSRIDLLCQKFEKCRFSASTLSCDSCDTSRRNAEIDVLQRK